MIKQKGSTGQGGVTTQVHFNLWRKPAQVKISISGVGQRDIEGGFGKIVFHRDGLQGFVWQPGIQRHNGSRVAGEDTVRKGIQLIDGVGHSVSCRRAENVRAVVCIAFVTRSRSSCTVIQLENAARIPVFPA